MSTNKKRSPQQKLQIVLEGLRADTKLSELCNRHGITQSQYYQWRDKLMSQGEQLFAHGGVDNQVQRQKNKIAKLERIIGQQTAELNELKKNEDDW